MVLLTIGQLGGVKLKIIDEVRQTQPLIYHLTNQVVMNFTANGLLAFGGSPIMAMDKSEAEEMAKISNGVLINIGTVMEKDIEAMIKAGQAANTKNIPILLDPVGIAATPFRQKTVQKLIDKIQFTAIKGNVGEMAKLIDVTWETKGVESTEGDVEKVQQICLKVAKKYHTIAIVTGPLDVISDGNDVIMNQTGHQFLTKITGAGCLLGSIITACLTTMAPSMEAAYAGVQFYGEAAEKAAKLNEVNGPGTFLPNFLDALHS